MAGPGHQETIAAYLSGRRQVRRAELDAAVAEANRDPAYRQQFARFVACTPDWQSDCRALRARLAEFAEYSPADLLRRFPALGSHLESCAICRRGFWEVKPRWTIVAADALRQTAGRFRRRLAANLQLLVTGSKTLIESGIAPLSEPVAAVAATAHAVIPGSIEAATAGGRREWRIEDESCGALVSLAASARQGEKEGAMVECALELPEGAGAGARLQLTDRATGRVIVSGPLSRFTDHPIELGTGSYLLTIECSPPSMFAWEIPIDILAGSKPAP